MNMKTSSIKTFITGIILSAAVLPACNEEESITRKDIRVETLTVAPATITVAVGGIRAIQAEVTPLGANQMIYWKSADSEIAEVANGIIMGRAPGSTIVTVNSVEDASKRAEINVTVVPTAIPVEEISFGVTSPLTVYTDETVQLTPQILPADATNQELLWTNSNPGVATVSETGLLTPVSRGTTILTIYAATDVNISATLNIEVTYRYIPVESFTFPNPQITIKPGEVYTATVTILPSDATNKGVSWSSSDETIATVVNGVITGVDIGNAVITAVSDDNPEMEAVLNVAVAANPDPFDVLVSAKGLWRFTDASNIGKASIGPDLTPVVRTGQITPLEGGRVRVGMSSYFSCQHGIAPSASGYVTEYTMLFDFAVPSTNVWRVFYLAKPGEDNEGEVYINNDRLGHGTYSSFAVTSNTWYRLIVVYKGDGTNYLYINGAFIYQYSGSGDATKSLAPEIRFFTDGWGGYDDEMDISTVAIWDRILSEAEITALDVAE